MKEDVPGQKPLQKTDTAQQRWKGRAIPEETRRICCQPGKQSKVDGVRLNLKARTCPARTVRFVTSPFHHSPILFCLFSGLINSLGLIGSAPTQLHGGEDTQRLLWKDTAQTTSSPKHLTLLRPCCKFPHNICIMQIWHMQISPSQNNVQSGN